MKRFYVLIGNFGSGKTEISLNLAFRAAKEGGAVLIDLDIINPYFRSAERKKELQAAGVKLHYPIFALSTVDVPSLPPDIYSAFLDENQTVIFDVGGDPAGATALGQYKNNFESIPADMLEVLYVVNPRRPFSATPDLVLDMLSRIQTRSRLSVTGFVNNGNLSTESSWEDILLGYDVLREVSGQSGIPVAYTAGEEKPLRLFLEKAEEKELDKRFIGEPMFIQTYMHRDWDRFTTFGV